MTPPPQPQNKLEAWANLLGGIVSFAIALAVFAFVIFLIS